MPEKFSLSPTDSQTSASRGFAAWRLKTAVFAFGVMSGLQFLWLTLRLILTLRKSSASVYDPLPQAWARALLSCSRPSRLYSVRHLPGFPAPMSSLTGTEKTAVWGTLAFVRSKPFGKSLARWMVARLKN